MPSAPGRTKCGWRVYSRCARPNTCIISNGFASMGIAVPGAIAAKMVSWDRAVVAVTGDAGYGLIGWKQMHRHQRSSHVDFTNPDFVKYAECFGSAGHRYGTVTGYT